MRNAPHLHGGDPPARRADRPATRDRLRPLTITSCAPGPGAVKTSPACPAPAPRRSPAWPVPAASSGSAGVIGPGRVRPPPAPSNQASPVAHRGTQRVELRRSAVLVTLGERVALGVGSLCRSAGRLAPGTPGAPSGDDRLVPAQRVDPDLGHGSVVYPLTRRARSARTSASSFATLRYGPWRCSACPRGHRRRSRA